MLYVYVYVYVYTLLPCVHMHIYMAAGRDLLYGKETYYTKKRPTIRKETYYTEKIPTRKETYYTEKRSIKGPTVRKRDLLKTEKRPTKR